jgi:hypothetical protein
LDWIPGRSESLSDSFGFITPCPLEHLYLRPIADDDNRGGDIDTGGSIRILQHFNHLITLEITLVIPLNTS